MAFISSSLSERSPFRLMSSSCASVAPVSGTLRACAALRAVVDDIFMNKWVGKQRQRDFFTGLFILTAPKTIAQPCPHFGDTRDVEVANPLGDAFTGHVRDALLEPHIDGDGFRRFVVFRSDA